MNEELADTAVIEPDDEPTDVAAATVGADDEAPTPEGPMVTLDDGDHPKREWSDWAGLAIAVACAVAVFITLNPSLIFRNTTPTGGDMGAHVWGPAYLKNELLPHLRLTGWTPDWYAGFPAYVFYMVVPSLFIVWLDMGLPLILGIPVAIAVVAGAVVLQRRLRTRMSRVVLWAVAVFLAVAVIDVPYNIAFKLVTVSGLVMLPLAAYALGRASRQPFPVAPLLALGVTCYLFEGGFSILGGNILSTMAGEFAFSISLTFAVLYLAVLLRGIDTGRYRALGALLFGLTILCHLIPAIFACIATLVIVVVRREDRTPWWDNSTAGRWIGAVAVAAVGVVLWREPDWFAVVGTVVALVMLIGFDWRALRWALVVLPTGFFFAAIWFVPFFLNSPYLNDMGWEKYTNYAQYLWPQPAQFHMVNRNMWFALAGAGMVLSLVHRVRLGWFLTLALVAFGWAFVFLPQYRLWNARLLPFYYLCIYLLAALAVALVLRALALVVGDLMHWQYEPWTVGLVGTVAVGLVALLYIAGSLQVLPGGGPVQFTKDDKTTATGYGWMGLTFKDINNSSSWAAYNFAGLEDPAKAYPEYSAVIAMMDKVGGEHGCGRAMWEYDANLSRFGTPMALMLMPYFTDGCIGSMEGLYFEASSTTPFHFINQSELSPSPSRAQRDLPYPNFDMAAGIRHLQLMGVPYYMASSQQAIDAARANPDLTEIASTPEFAQTDGTKRQWVVFQVADAEPVVPLENLPVVVTPEDDHIDGWVYDTERPPATKATPNPQKTPGPAMDWYLDPSRWGTPLATSGPPNWPRVSRDPAPTATSVPVTPVEVSNVKQGKESISFDVSDTGSPVLVRTSYFPNWQASGADGPYRVSPNFMVVVPTERHVSLSYGRTGVDYTGYLMALIGIVVMVVLARADDRRRTAELHLTAVAGSSPPPPPPAAPDNAELVAATDGTDGVAVARDGPSPDGGDGGATTER